MVVKSLKTLLCCYVSILSFGTFLSSSELTHALELASLLPKKVAGPTVPKVGSQKVFELLQAHPNINGVIDVPVLQQGFSDGWPFGNLGNLGLMWDDVKGIDGGNCGYHALKNVLFLMNALERNQDQFISALLQKQPFFDCMSIWAPMIYEERSYDVDVSWLGGQEIDYLKNNLGRLLKINAFNSLSVRERIVVTEDVRDVGVNIGLPVNETMLQPIKELAQKLNGMLGVIWTAGHGGHWVGFVVYKKNGFQKIYYMNSARDIHPNFKQIVELFSMNVKDIDNIAFQNQLKNVLQDLARMQNTCDVLLNRNNKDQAIYSQFVGCVQRRGSMLDVFTKEQLQDSSLDVAFIARYLDKINLAWKNYLRQEVNMKEEPFKQAYFSQISNPKQRCYGFWHNPENDMVFALNLDFENCQIAKDRYKNSQLIIDHAYQVSFFNSAEKIHAVFNYILIAWQSYDRAVFDNQIVQQKIHAVFKVILPYLKNHPDIYNSINWQEFGSEPVMRRFKGFKDVMAAVFSKLKIDPNAYAQWLS